MTTPDKNLTIRFDHGLGDYANLAHVLALYVARGYRITVSCSEDKVPAIMQDGVTFCNCVGGEEHPWWESSPPHDGNVARPWEYNKAAGGISSHPLPSIGSAGDLWRELCAVRLPLAPFLSPSYRDAARAMMDSLPRPVILVHTKGNTGQGTKSIPDDVALDACRRLLDTTDGSIVLLDWDNRVPRIASSRVRHTGDDWGHVSTNLLAALMEEADLLLGIDSGPLHFARRTSIPIVGVFGNREHYPSRYALPCERFLSVVPSSWREWNKQIRDTYPLVESPGDSVSAESIAAACRAMLAPLRYLPDTDKLAEDVMLQQWVGEWERGGGNQLSAHMDRNRSVDVLLREIGRRFTSPQIVETGCIRSSEDWAGAGYGTYLLGTFARHYGGQVTSVDNDAAHCVFARSVCRGLPVEVQESDSVDYLSDRTSYIDVLILDSMDADLPGAEDHGLFEIQAAERLLHHRSIVVYDDTVFQAGTWRGKGAKGVPYLLERGWRLLYGGYQAVLVRQEP